MKIKYLILFLLIFSCTAFAMGGPPDPNIETLEIKKSFVEQTNYPFSISIDKPSLDLITEPGKTKTGNIIVENNGKQPLKIIVYTEDWTYEEDGSKAFLKAGSTKNSCANWIHVRPSSFMLNPRESEEIEYIITTPKDASGGKVAVIFFESIFGEKEGVVLGGRIGSIIYQETKDKVKKTGEISKFNAEVKSDNIVNLVVEFENKGNAHIFAYPKVEIYSSDGKKVSEIEMPRIKALPTEKAFIEDEISLDKKSEYRAVVKIEIEGEVLEKATNFSLH